MAVFMLMAHSGWRYVVIGLLVLAAIKMVVGWLRHQDWTEFDARLLLALRAAVYLQVVLGALLYILLQFWVNMRFTGEHVLVALLAVGGVEFAAARSKKAATAAGKFKAASIGLIITFGLIYVALHAVGGLFGSMGSM